MIRKLYANKTQFKPVEFQTGLNVILADRNNTSSEKDSRNGIGKSTFISVLHFCLGSNLNKKLLPVDEMQDWVFYIDIELNEIPITASRNIESPSTIFVVGNFDKLPISPEVDDESGKYFYKMNDWRLLLGELLFGLKAAYINKYKPSYRMLVSYFIRSGKDAYSEPFTYLRNQKSWQKQIANAYLLGLKWEHASEVQELKDINNAVNALEGALDAGVIKTKGEMESEKVRLQGEHDVMDKQLSDFKVHEKYKDIQTKGNDLTVSIHKLVNQNFTFSRKLSRYKESVASEGTPEESSVTKLFEDAGVTFNSGVKKSLAETQVFHSEIIKNRKLFLQAEINELDKTIIKNNQAIEELSNNRAEVVSILNSHRALEEFNLLQSKAFEIKAKLENIKLKISDIQEISTKKKEIKADRINIDNKIQIAHEELRNHWEEAIDLFNKNSLALYDDPGYLIINTSEKGSIKENAFSFGVDIPRSNSEGVGRMKLYCYDLMLVDIFSRNNEIDFLVHDSTMFDSVDSRQVAHALEHAHKKGVDSNFQYICTFNSNLVPATDFSEEFNINDFVRLRLSDKNPENSLLGFRFELN
jgi:uncharacterized protein YydD (DUF2326 family)